MANKLWLALAASAIISSGSVSAEVASVATDTGKAGTQITEEAEAGKEVAALMKGLSAKEQDVVAELFQAIADGQLSLCDLDAIKVLTDERKARAQRLRKAMIIVATVVVGGLGGWALWKHLKAPAGPAAL